MPPESLTTSPGASKAGEVDQFAVNYWKARFDKRPPTLIHVIETLDVEYNELAQSWKRFQELLAPTDRVCFEERPQTAPDVQAVVRGVQALWGSSPQQRAFRRSMALCDTFAATLDSHTVTLTTLPNHQFYSALFYGVLQSMLKACATYPNIMERMMSALVNVNQSISPSVESGTLQFPKESVPLIARFYYLTFFFLGEFMDWYARRSKCRLLQSLNEDMYLDFGNLVGAIQSSARDFMQGFIDVLSPNDCDYERTLGTVHHPDLYLWEQARLSQIGRRHVDRRFAAQNAMTRLLIWGIQRDAEERQGIREKRDVLLAQMFETASQRLRPASQQNGGIACLTTTPGPYLTRDTYTLETSGGPRHKYSRVELQLASAHLQDYFDSDDQIAGFETDVGIIAEDSVIESLKQWGTNAYSQVLAIGGFTTTVFPSPVALISACYANLAREIKLPVVAHFCSLPTTAKDGMTLFQQGLIALTYSLIRQLIDCLPPVSNGSAAYALKAERFSPLNGTLTSWKEVLSLIDTLLHYAPPLLVCVVDGLDKLHDTSTDEYIRSLVRTFVDHTKPLPDLVTDSYHSHNTVLLKVLFTVTGRPSSLVGTLFENTLILSESNRPEQVVAADPSLNPNVTFMMMNA
ncbi:hypothetical protein P175DRAFT_0559316 [Aspergillus ochraceoroseus IBT 24754]|uniref:DUF7708 domain-containing protein n=3 Tax=Aspergillus subgen. Nidulantes TaxID=2720870 RepID=A0A0F8X838_9EURO|nr:uncharacterized protein P175DRAFT_0559316 [Aspergillus ochraceoroseus IBT 24754]KKK14058.1 hypothetical protein AOCH_002697 [Aspergillus ochraceoroseus]KKK19762.1 hypothetical protein ARAM_007397 [Aspergillus rambellii]PTU18491.1 hypothetical protein P175DRAFT_0559316 [Aspergillus ochraceoroseus IBT 24754]